MRLSRDKLIWLAYLLISLVLFFGNPQQRIKKADFLLNYTFLPLNSSIKWITKIVTTERDNQRLKTLLAAKEQELRETTELLHIHDSIAELQRSLNWRPSQADSLIISTIISHIGNRDSRTLLIDKGRGHEIKVNMPVITSHGIVGKILSVANYHAIVLPITNPLFKLGVITEKSNIHGTLEADLDGKIFMTKIRSGAQINVGDVVITSSYSTIFPRGYKVGTVSRLIKDPQEVSMKAEIEPFNDIDTLEHVIILLYNKDIPDEL
ncbi:MAG: rod shape-determining protein MreC [Candidatus Cloacimonetes bacterium]|nr:rod shape-determining protein MreC [Candidatus Cloacimonadota bacterium]